MCRHHFKPLHLPSDQIPIATTQGKSKLERPSKSQTTQRKKKSQKETKQGSLFRHETETPCDSSNSQWTAKRQTLMRSLAKLRRRGVAIEEASFGDPTGRWFCRLITCMYMGIKAACNSQKSRESVPCFLSD